MLAAGDCFAAGLACSLIFALRYRTDLIFDRRCSTSARTCSWGEAGTGTPRRWWRRGWRKASGTTTGATPAPRRRVPGACGTRRWCGATPRSSGAPGSCATPAILSSSATTSRQATTARAGPTDRRQLIMSSAQTLVFQVLLSYTLLCVVRLCVSSLFQL